MVHQVTSRRSFGKTECCYRTLGSSYFSLEQVIFLEELSLEIESIPLILPSKIKKKILKNTNLRNSFYSAIEIRLHHKAPPKVCSSEAQKTWRVEMTSCLMQQAAQRITSFFLCGPDSVTKRLFR